MNDRLRADLTSGADTYDLPPADLDAVVRRGRQRNRRRHRVSATVAAIAVVAAGATTYQLANPDEKTNVASQASGSGQLGDSGIEWKRVDADPASSLAYAYSPVAELDGTTYAVSTAPGRVEGDKQAPRALWRSTDGVAWEQATLPSFSPGRIAAGDGRLYAIGTGVATAGTEVHIGWSDGGTSAWEDRTLPVDTSAMQAISSSPVQVIPRDVAATKDAIVGVVNVVVDLDITKVLPGVSAPNGWYLGADGIDVLGNGPECPEGTSPNNPAAEAKRRAAEAEGIKVADRERPDGDRTNQQQYQTYCFTPDGRSQSYEPTQTFGVASHHSFAELGLSGDVLRAVRHQAFVFRSDVDGTSFERVDVGDDVGPAEVEAADGGFVLAVPDVSKPAGKTSPVLLRSSDGKVWQPDTSLPSIGYVMAMGTVDGHLALVGSLEDSALFAQLVDGTWRTTDLRSLVDGPKSWVGNAAIGPLGVVVVAGSGKGDGTEQVLLTSRDGETWSSQSVDELVDRSSGASGINQVVVKDDRAVALVSIYPKGGGTARQVALVGTPR